MRFISYISVFMIPVLILYILGYGLIAKRNIYGAFLEGAEEGLKIVRSEGRILDGHRHHADTDRTDDFSRCAARVRFS